MNRAFDQLYWSPLEAGPEHSCGARFRKSFDGGRGKLGSVVPTAGICRSFSVPHGVAGGPLLARESAGESGSRSLRLVVLATGFPPVRMAIPLPPVGMITSLGPGWRFLKAGLI